jgi:hypothetical protein
MWIVLKYDKKNIKILINELKKKFNNDLKIYNPKFKTKFKIKDKIIINELSLLDDYLFCYHKNFNNPNSTNVLKFTKGIKDFIHGHKSSQNDIKEFINRCRKSEDKEGYLTNKFYNLYENSRFKFNSGIFSNFIFKVINLQKNKMNILLGNLSVTTRKEKFILKSI